MLYLQFAFLLLMLYIGSRYGYFFIPNYPSDIATVNFDVTGTTKIGNRRAFVPPELPAKAPRLGRDAFVCHAT